MEKEEKINFWKISANKDFEMMEFLYKEKRLKNIQINILKKLGG